MTHIHEEPEKVRNGLISGPSKEENTLFWAFQVENILAKNIHCVRTPERKNIRKQITFSEKVTYDISHISPLKYLWWHAEACLLHLVVMSPG